MKKQFLFILLLVLATNVFSQPATPTTPAVKTDYLKKSKTQKTVANIFLATGASCVLAGYLIPKGEKVTVSTGGTLWGIPLEDAYNKNDNIKGTFLGIGILTMLSSIPIYLAAHHSKKKAMRLSFKNETAPQLQNSSFINRPVPSLALKTSL